MALSIDPTRMLSSRLQSFSYALSDADSYQEQKGLTVAQQQQRTLSVNESGSPCSVFGERIRAVLQGQKRLAPSIYPGPLIPAPGPFNSFINRGNLFRQQFEYFREHGWFPDAGSILDYRAVSNFEPWVWSEIDQPRLNYVVARAADRSEPPTAVIADSTSIEACLSGIHRLWDCRPITYSPAAIEQSKSWLQSVENHTAIEANGDDVLSALFEVEAGASFITYTENLPVIADLMVDGNVATVFRKALSSIRQTELCLPERIFDELLNLPSGRFAPIVLNEYDTVADGNHRLTSSWIWNVLRQCLDVEWSIRSQEFQASIRRALIRTGLFGSPVTLQQVLFHLGLLLSREDLARELESRLKLAMFRSKAIDYVPVVFVSEYLSCAANKEDYDAGRAVSRAHPSLYRAMSEAPNIVLPPRSSYHYTDRVLLPWFDVIN